MIFFRWGGGTLALDDGACDPSSSSCEQRSLLSWIIARRGVCAQITCRKLVLIVLVVT